ncbi:MAG: spore protease YyaC [Negativicutes bacterium]|nr:spore protease YyaC [Negativicutes bacterium]
MLNSLRNNTSVALEHKFNIHQPESSAAIADALLSIIRASGVCGKDIIVLCIGTDRSTGDALGPLTGSKLQSLRFHPHIFGTLENPVHATNLTDTLNSIQQSFRHPFIIAVDACLGRLENVGYVSLGHGPLKPGAGVNKDLPHVGDAYITGIVNVAGFMEHLVLQSTRLSLVVKMADAIASGLAYSLGDLN